MKVSTLALGAALALAVIQPALAAPRLEGVISDHAAPAANLFDQSGLPVSPFELAVP